MVGDPSWRSLTDNHVSKLLIQHRQNSLPFLPSSLCHGAEPDPDASRQLITQALSLDIHALYSSSAHSPVLAALLEEMKVRVTSYDNAIPFQNKG